MYSCYCFCTLNANCCFY